MTMKLFRFKLMNVANMKYLGLDGEIEREYNLSM